MVVLAKDSLAVGRRRHEVRLVLQAGGASAVRTGTLRSVHLPNVLAIVVVARVVRVTGRLGVVDVVSRVLTRETLRLGIIGESPIDPIAIELTVARSS